MIVYLLGYETTSNCLAYTSYLLALHPDKQDMLYQEIEKFYHENPVSKVYYGVAEIIRDKIQPHFRWQNGHGAPISISFAFMLDLCKEDTLVIAYDKFISFTKLGKQC